MVGDPVRPSTDAVDEALAEVLFSTAMAGRPVYAVPDAEALEAIASRLGVPSTHGLELLKRTAAVQVGLGEDAQPFSKLARRARAHRGA